MKNLVIAASTLVALAGSAFGGIEFRLVAVTSDPVANSQAAASVAYTPNGNPAISPSNTYGTAGPFINRSAVSGAIPGLDGRVSSGTLGSNITGAAAYNPALPVSQTNQNKYIFVLQARWTGITGANGFATVGGNILTDETAGRANMSRYVENAVNQAAIDGDPDTGVQSPATRMVWGTFAPYNSLANLGDPNDPNANGDVGNTGGTWYVKNILGLQTGTGVTGLATGVWANIYGFAYQITDNSARTVHFNFSDTTSGGGQYSSVYSNTNGGQPNPIDNTSYPGGIGTASFSLSIVPAPASAALLGLGGLVAARRRRMA